MSLRPTRRTLLASGVAAIVGGLAGCVGEPTDDGTPNSPSAATQPDATSHTPSTETATGELPSAVGVERLADGFTAPIGVEFLPDGTALVADQAGTVQAIADAQTRQRPVLDIRDRMVSLSGYEERGLLGIAVHPDYPADPRLFVRYSAPPREATPDSHSHTFVLASFRLDAETPVADPDSERAILEIPEPQGNHNAGAIAFGPDGYLYVGVGDGGGGNDVGTGHVADWYDANAGGNGQDVTANLLGSILRIDVTDTGEDPYSVPEANPLLGREGLDEHFAWGLRNPWGMSFHDGELYAADVGQNRFEEINHVRAGGNYGWNVREGRHCFSTESPGSSPDSCPADTPDGEPLIDPVVEYPHSGQPVSGVAVVGGYVYAGEAMPGLSGRYVFADWQADGQLFVATPTEDGPWQTAAVPIESEAVGSQVLGFGRDATGAVYVCTSERGQVTGSTGAVYRLTPA
ncbi:sorbosone dehydrogenase family protein [Halorhabdus sp. CUG00001]|uniref:PQQ-dependent sugar dehydrogenase n=1 Tax=Halorhabdus sp. CUG00001 TaxID=2600297 RepID=UPI00131A97BE|nr:PQQ-dependent sugar dehydrogenase [Halorhabdus sp. CUG00001]